MEFQRMLKRYFVIFDEEELSRTHGIDVYEGLIKFLRWQLKVVGYDVLEIPFRPGKMTAFSTLCLTLFMIFTVYTVWFLWGDWFKVIESLSILGMGSSSLIKAYTGLMNAEFYQGNYRRLTALYRRYEKHFENNRQLVFWGILITYGYRFLLLVTIAGSFGFVVLPIVTYIQFKERMLLLTLHIPGIDTVSTLGYTITTLFHATLLIMAVAGILAADTGILIIVGHVTGIADVFKNALHELDQLTEREDRKEDEIQKKLQEICVMHQEIITYEEDLDENYGSTVFVQVLSSVGCIALSLFNFYMTYNIGALTFLLFAFFQLLQFCVLGTILTIKNDEVMLALYDICWYRLSSDDQKMIGFMLHRSQNAVEMTVGGLAPLNMETFVEIMKTIYSYSAMLAQFLE